MGSINSQGVYEYDVTDDEIGPVLLNRQSAALTNLFQGRANTVRVANVSQRAAALAAHGTPSTSNPLIVFRADAGEGREIEYTTNGALWHTVAAEEDTGWEPITSFQNGFSARPGYEPAVRVKGGVAYLSGEVYRSTEPTSLTVAFDLPAFAGAPRSPMAVIVSSTWDSRLFVSEGGQVLVSANVSRTSSTGFYVGGLTWPVD